MDSFGDGGRCRTCARSGLLVRQEDRRSRRRIQDASDPGRGREVHPERVRDQFHALGTLEANEVIQVVGEVNAIVVRMPLRRGPAGRRRVPRSCRTRRPRDPRRSRPREALCAQQAQSNFDRAEKPERAAGRLAAAARRCERGAAGGPGERIASRSARLDKTRIRAPWSGLIGRKRVSPGAYIRSGDVIAELARVDEMKLAFTAARALPRRAQGRHSRRTSSTPAYPGEAFRGAVTVVDPIIDPSTRTVQVVARIPNRRRRLRPGMSANVSVTFAERSMRAGGARTKPCSPKACRTSSTS